MKIEQAYNIWATQYDTNKNKTRDLDKVINIKTLSTYEFNTVLELGCGTGKNTEWLALNAKKVLGLDFSTEMLNIAKSKITANHVTFKTADLTQNWDVEDDFADLITSSLTLEHIHDLTHIFNQAKQKVKQGGLFFISELHPFKQYAGSKARFETEKGTQELEVFTHHISEFTNEAHKHGFKLLELNEWFDQDLDSGLPRLVSFVFKNQ